MPLIVKLLNASAAEAQFAPVWGVEQIESLASHGLRPEHFRLLFEGDRAIACAAVWDQRSSRQAVVRRYPPLLRLGRVALNLLSPLTRLPKLPPVGTPIPLGLISHIATPTGRPELIVPLANALNKPARALGVNSIGVGFDARDPRLAIARSAFGGREYRTMLDAVHWEVGREAAAALDDRLCQPEVALL